jgi:hypothetical protein
MEKIKLTYPLVFKVIYRFGNIFTSLLLIAYLFPLIYLIEENKIFIVPVTLSLLLIYFINKHYILLYKILPFTIEADEEKMICRDFIFSKKEHVIYFSDIQSVSGGVFENKISGLMKIFDGKYSVTIGFYQKMKNSNKLITMILSKAKREIYDEVIEKISSGKKIKKEQ